MWIAASFMVVAAILVPRFGNPDLPGVVHTLEGLLYGVAILIWIMYAWVMPFFEPLTPPPQHSSPREVLWGRIYGEVWTPTYLAGIAVCVCVLVMVIQSTLLHTVSNVLFVPILTVLLIGVLLATVPVSAAVARAYTQRYRAFIRNAGYCFNCGYNLRGNREAEHCPECGEPVPGAEAEEDRPARTSANDP